MKPAKLLSAWSRGMIRPLGGRGREFDSRSGPFTRVAQWIAHLTSNQGVAGSSPASGKTFFHAYFTVIINT